MTTEQQLRLLALRFIRETERDLESALSQELSALEQYLLLLQELNDPKLPGADQLMATSKKKSTESQRTTE